MVQVTKSEVWNTLYIKVRFASLVNIASELEIKALVDEHLGLGCLWMGWLVPAPHLEVQTMLSGLCMSCSASGPARFLSSSDQTCHSVGRLRWFVVYAIVLVSLP